MKYSRAPFKLSDQFQLLHQLISSFARDLRDHEAHVLLQELEVLVYGLRDLTAFHHDLVVDVPLVLSSRYIFLLGPSKPLGGKVRGRH